MSNETNKQKVLGHFKAILEEAAPKEPITARWRDMPHMVTVIEKLTGTAAVYSQLDNKTMVEFIRTITLAGVVWMVEHAPEDAFEDGDDFEQFLKSIEKEVVTD